MMPPNDTTRTPTVTIDGAVLTDVQVRMLAVGVDLLCVGTAKTAMDRADESERALDMNMLEHASALLELLRPGRPFGRPNGEPAE